MEKKTASPCYYVHVCVLYTSLNSSFHNVKKKRDKEKSLYCNISTVHHHCKWLKIMKKKKCPSSDWRTNSRQPHRSQGYILSKIHVGRKGGKWQEVGAGGSCCNITGAWDGAWRFDRPGNTTKQEQQKNTQTWDMIKATQISAGERRIHVRLLSPCGWPERSSLL